MSYKIIQSNLITSLKEESAKGTVYYSPVRIRIHDFCLL